MLTDTPDPDNILSRQARDSIDRMLYNLEKLKGVQGLVAVANEVEDGDCYQFGMDLGQKYGVGKKSTRTGFVLVLAKKDHCFFLLTGEGLEGFLPDAICKRLENKNLVPYLKENKWDAGATMMVGALCKHLLGQDDLVDDGSGDDGDSSWLWPVVACGGIILLVVLCSIFLKPSTYCPKCRSKKLLPTGNKKKEKPGGELLYEYKCRKCGYVVWRKKEKNSSSGNGSGGGGSSSLNGGSSSFHDSDDEGGSYGGGSFGGGGAGGRF